MITTSSSELPHPAMVQRSVYVVPALPLKPDVGEVEAENDPPLPLTMDHPPDPETGVFAARVVVVLQMLWSAPAFDGVGSELKVIVT